MNPGEHYPHLGKIVVGTEISANNPDMVKVRKIIFLLAGSVALMMTGFGIIMPVFARRFGEFGSGVEDLGLMTMSFALAQLIAAPFMGSLADRFGRRPLVLISLIAFAVSNIGFLWAPTTAIFIAIRTLEGGLTAGLFPATMGVVGDLIPERKRAQWIGIVMGSYSVGFIFGPAIGGGLYDLYGFEAPFIVSAVMGFLAFFAAGYVVPETRTAVILNRSRLRQLHQPLKQAVSTASFMESLPRPLLIFFTLLLLNFITAFGFAFIEPQMVFYFYDDLGWSTTRFGLVVGAFGISMVASQMFLGRLSDRFGRKPIVIIGLMLSLALYFGLAYLQVFALMMLAAFIAGIGDALKGTAIGAFFLDITSDEHRSRVMGLKGSSLAMGGVFGPALLAVLGGRISPRNIFIIAGCTIVCAVIMALVVLREPKGEQKKHEAIDIELNEKRQMAALACLRGVVSWAATLRGQRET